MFEENKKGAVYLSCLMIKIFLLLQECEQVREEACPSLLKFVPTHFFLNPNENSRHVFNLIPLPT